MRPGSPKTNTDPKAILLVLVVLGLVLFVGFDVMQAYASTQASEGVQSFDEFCHDVYGDEAETYVSNTMGAHGGLHCNAPGTWAGDIHYSQLPQEQYQAYLNGTVSAQTVVENLEPMPAGPFGILPGWVWSGIGIFFVVLTGFVIVVYMTVGPRPPI